MKSRCVQLCVRSHLQYSLHAWLRADNDRAEPRNQIRFNQLLGSKHAHHRHHHRHPDSRTFKQHMGALVGGHPLTASTVHDRGMHDGPRQHKQPNPLDAPPCVARPTSGDTFSRNIALSPMYDSSNAASAATTRGRQHRVAAVQATLPPLHRTRQQHVPMNVLFDLRSRMK